MRRLPPPTEIARYARARLPWLSNPAQHDSPLPYMASRPTVNPILPVRDMDEAIAFYRQLCFTVVAYDAGYAWVRNCGWELFHLGLATDLGPAGSSAAAYIHVDDADGWHVALAAAAGNADIGDLVDQPWGMREFSFSDPSGNVIRIGQNR